MLAYWVAMGLFFITTFTRVGFMFLKQPVKISATLEQALKLAPAIVLSTSIVLEVFSQQSPLEWQNPKLLAIALGACAYFIRKNALDAMLCGLLVWLLHVFIF